MNHYLDNIEEEATKNNNFRKVLYTGNHSQLVVMSLKRGEEIGMETHENVDQFFRIEQGRAKFIIDGKELLAEKNYAVIVPAGSKHNVLNNGLGDLKMYTLYSPANHPEGTIHKTKEDAEIAEKSGQ